jgi:probable phosphoglycerate mutase
VTVFHLLRHGEPNVFGRINGRLPGVGLSGRGRAEIAAVAARLADEQIAALYASPLQRTQETAEILSERLGLPVGGREEVIEVDFGEWTGLTADDIRKDPRWQLWSNCRSIASIPGGESWRQVQDRAVGALFDLQRVHPGDSVVIVSHGDVIRSALLFALGMPLDFYSRIEVALASISTIRLDGSGIRVLALNETPRLPPVPP